MAKNLLMLPGLAGTTDLQKRCLMRGEKMKRNAVWSDERENYV